MPETDDLADYTILDLVTETEIALGSLELAIDGAGYQDARAVTRSVLRRMAEDRLITFARPDWSTGGSTGIALSDALVELDSDAPWEFTDDALVALATDAGEDRYQSMPLMGSDLVETFNEHNRDLEHQRSGPDVDTRSRWVERHILAVVDREPEHGWVVLRELVERVHFDGTDSDALTLLGAGALEDFVKAFGPEFIDRLVVALDRSPRWRTALRQVRGVDPAVAERLRAAMALHAD